MIRSLQLEWLKIRNYRLFWILFGMYLLALVVISSGGAFFLLWLKSEGADFDGIDPTILPIYDFPDIWQNITYLASFNKILLAFIIIISVNNDIIYNTLRQNVIDGISKKEYLLSKLMLIFSLAAISTLFLFVAGLINGSIYSHVWGINLVFDETEFLFAYFYDIIIYCTLAFLLSLVVKKAGFVIIALFLYTIMFEPIATAIFINAPYFKEGMMPDIVQYLPIKSLNNLIPVPYGRYIFMEIEDNIPLKGIIGSTVWFAIYLSSIVFILNKRDLK